MLNTTATCTHRPLGRGSPHPASARWPAPPPPPLPPRWPSSLVSMQVSGRVGQAGVPEGSWRGVRGQFSRGKFAFAELSTGELNVWCFTPKTHVRRELWHGVCCPCRKQQSPPPLCPFWGVSSGFGLKMNLCRTINPRLEHTFSAEACA